ncbi:hypothetical protein [Andrias davidianus ranavirus]|uniref:Uncharacterized protein n=3 Tax=Ranavirus TaxID=10492 RepID=V5KX25_9VIRU|nr:unknown [Soft-shelled turtle iridovirus]AHA42306.1 hypothetical protein [Andrias davidianus ranavirus]AHA80884.1 hypothetical protein [Chinese giant salamander iridovirus]UYY91444.1 hypothetical protein [Percocypris pingi ranavirus]
MPKKVTSVVNDPLVRCWLNIVPPAVGASASRWARRSLTRLVLKT